MQEIHTPEEYKIINEFIESIDENVKNFVEEIVNEIDKAESVTVTVLSNRAADEIEMLTGKKVEGSRVVLDKNAIKHIIKRHGPNGLQDTSMKDINDISRMGYVINNYDSIEYEGITTTGYLDENGKPSPMIAFKKRIDGMFYVVNAVNSSKKKKNYIVSAYIKSAKK